MTIQEEKLISVFDQYWKGLMEYRDYTVEDKRRIKKEYTAEEFYEALKAAYNAGIEIAANNTTTIKTYHHVLGEEIDVDKDSILKLQIE